MSAGWQVLSDPESPAVHVIPALDSDLCGHDLAEDCPCGPAVEPVECEGGYINWMYSHHSLDGREQREGER